jgi:hypothetical protein
MEFIVVTLETFQLENVPIEGLFGCFKHHAAHLRHMEYIPRLQILVKFLGPKKHIWFIVVAFDILHDKNVLLKGIATT